MEQIATYRLNFIERQSRVSSYGDCLLRRFLGDVLCRNASNLGLMRFVPFASFAPLSF